MITYYLQFSEWKGMIGILGRNIPEAQCEAEADLWTVHCTQPRLSGRRGQCCDHRSAVTVDSRPETSLQ